MWPFNNPSGFIVNPRWLYVLYLIVIRVTAEYLLSETCVWCDIPVLKEQGCVFSTVCSSYYSERWLYQKATNLSLKGEIRPRQDMTLTFDLLTPKSIEVHLGSWSIHVYANRKWSFHAGTMKSSKSKYDLDLWSFDPKINRGPPRVMVNILSIFSICQKEMGLSCWNGKKFKVKIWPWPLGLKIYRGPPQVIVNSYVRYHHCKSKGKGVIMQKSLFHRQMIR